MKWFYEILFFGKPFESGEVQRRFGDYFEIERIAGKIDYSKFPPGYAVYLMTRKNGFYSVSQPVRRENDFTA